MKKNMSSARSASQKSWDQAKQLAAKNGKSVKECRTELKQRRLSGESLPNQTQSTVSLVLPNTLSADDIGRFSASLSSVAAIARRLGSPNEAREIIELVHEAGPLELSRQMLELLGRLESNAAVEHFRIDHRHPVPVG